MLIRFDDLEGTAIEAKDDKVGKVGDLYFDDRDWKVRYLIADTDGWFSSRKVLLSPASVDEFDLEDDVIRMNLTKKQIESSPPIGTNEPVSRKMEAQLVKHYDWPTYWSVLTPSMGDAVVTPVVPRPGVDPRQPEVEDTDHGVLTASDDQGLRSAEEVKGYDIRTMDGSVGHVDGFIYDPESWDIRYLVVDTRRILPGKKVLIPRPMITDVSWETREVTIATTEDHVRTAPAYDQSGIEREDETKILSHFGRSAEAVRSE
ncbi:MAG: PRC-barrel domain-containing protein [Candidatus Eisenbacteria bacterium]|uniref:PRC-barrel domain-containing protein n=1 Tax=Eiseniibacteriota bacterium TaxID=2212470 RepID=A0A956NGG3_UNCEI|nr:PRC-barrel domain-containing protein [Candidatus Eisenbacteria bacterium]